MVFLILAVVWAAILASWYRARRQRSLPDSVGTFRRHLNVIERVTPRSVRAANSRRGPRPAAPAMVPAYATAVGFQPVARRLPHPPSGLSRRRRSQRRRREVFFLLFGGVVGAAALWTLLPLSSVLYLQVAMDVSFLAYLGLLIRARNLAAEREMKVRFLEFPSGRYAESRQPAAGRAAAMPNYAASLDYKVPAARVRTARPAV